MKWIDISHEMTMAIWTGYLERMTKSKAIKPHHQRRDRLMKKLHRAYENHDKVSFDALKTELKELDDELYATRHTR